jgi:hypothetical protein
MASVVERPHVLRDSCLPECLLPVLIPPPIGVEAPSTLGVGEHIVRICLIVDVVVSTDYIDHQGIDRSEIHGREGFGDLVSAVHAPHGTALRVTVEELIGEGDRAAARLRWYHTGEDGRVVERETIDIIRTTKGLAVEHWGAEVSRFDAG